LCSPHFNHTHKRHPKSNLRTPTRVRHFNGYGSHTYSLIDAAGERVWLKYQFKPLVSKVIHRILSGALKRLNFVQGRNVASGSTIVDLRGHRFEASE
jgi:hypothetical protein